MVNELKYKPICINGQKITPNDLLINNTAYSFAQKEDITCFIKNWLNTFDYIDVKTSGSTGTPKTIPLKKNAFVESALQTIKFFKLQEGDSVLLCLPVKFIAGKMMLMRAWIAGLNLISINPSLNPFTHISKQIILNFAAMTPMQVSSVLDGDDGKKKINRIKNLIIGGAPVNNNLEKKLQTLTTACYATYGMTETLSHVALKKLNGADKSNSYKALPGITFNIDNRNCLVINAPKLSDNLIVTNDVVELLWTNEFLWKGRYDNVINSGGIKIFPEELEKKLENILNRNYFFGSIPDEQIGERVILVIEGEKFDPATEKMFTDFLVTNFEKYQQPKKIFFTDNFVYTKTGKINRKKTINLLAV